MKFVTQTSSLANALSLVEGVVSNREISSPLSDVRLDVQKDKLFLSATDLETSIRFSLLADIQKTGEASIPAKELSSMVKNLNFTSVSLETKLENNAPITYLTDPTGQKKSGFTINGKDPEELKTFPQIDKSKLVSISVSTLKEVISKTISSVALDDTRYIFNGLFFKTEDSHLIVVGTDGRRLTKISRQLENNLKIEKGIIVPHKAIRQIERVLEQGTEANIGVFEDQFYLQVGNAEIISKLIDGNYPDYNQVFPKSVTGSAIIPRDEFSVVVKQALVTAEEPTRQIKIKFKTSEIEVTSATPGRSVFATSIPVEYKGEELTFAFKGDYLADVGKIIQNSSVELNFTSPQNPVVYKDSSDPNFIGIIMPMKV